MDLITTGDLGRFASAHDGPKISIYMPTHRTAPDVKQDRIRLKNLVGEVQDRLEASDHRRDEITPIVSPLMKLVESDAFWEARSDGLAVLADADVMKTYRLPASFEPVAAVSPRYLLKPLIGFLATDCRYFVLALSRNSVRLFQASRLSVSEVDLESVPTSLAEALRFDDPESQLQFHTGTSQSSNGPDRRAMFHGHGVGTDDEESNTIRFLKKVDKGLHDVLADEHAPLVLAGVKDLLACYRGVNTYSHLVDGEAEGNPDHMSGKELHERTWSIVEPVFLKGLREAFEQFAQLHGERSDLAVTGLEDVVACAHEGRVRTLFAARGEHVWGTFDPEAVEVTRHDSSTDENLELIDFAAVRTFATRGEVYVVPPDRVPGDGHLAAVLRF
ncbi:MAG: hypothetical protein GF405_06250 [Candidatus Eisenbacteria bacterium]|nr:hypothetical protein [Candidatus Eisenbacteria bacterium]